MKPAAILWDYDGTLVDSTVKNRMVTIGLLKQFDPQVESHLPAALRNVETYREAILRWTNWREEFRQELGLNDGQIRCISRQWSAAQIADPLQPPLFCGLRNVIPVLAEHAPMAICSQNGEEHILATLRRYGLDCCFRTVVGRDTLTEDHQKPDPAGFLMALERMGIRGDEGELVYIGDHSMDVLFARAAEKELRSRGIQAETFTVTTRFGDHACMAQKTGADAGAAEPEDLLKLL